MMYVKHLKTDNAEIIIVEGQGYSFYLSVDEAREFVSAIEAVLQRAETTTKEN